MVNSKLILTLLFIVFILIVVHILISRNSKTRENFKSNSNSKSENDIDLFESTSDFVEYSRNSEKLLDMFKSLEEAEQRCASLDDFHNQQEEKENMRENDKSYKELQEQDKKIDELKEIVKYLTIEMKRRTKIDSRCRNTKQRKLNKQYDVVNNLNKSQHVNDNSLNLDLNISDSNTLNSLFNKSKKKKKKKCSIPSGSDHVNLNVKDINKCSGCSSEKLAEQSNFINKDFE
jgi:hypothetical protein